MKSRIPVGLALMLVALALSFVPAASIGTQSASALSACDWAQFVTDVTVPDGTTFAANAAFTKTWRLKNIGSCTWTTSYALVFDSGNAMGGPTSVNLPNSVAPGQTVDVSVGLTAPSSPGHYIGYWEFMNSSASRFGIGSMGNKAWWVEITVGTGTSGVAYDFAANYCSAEWFSTAGNLPCSGPGLDGDPRGFVLKVDNPKLEDGTTDSGSGLITNPRNIFNGDIHGKFPAFHVQHGDRFQSIVNCAYGATGCYVSFRLDYQIDDGPIYTFWAFREKFDGLYYRADLDLNSLAGRDVKFILTVLADGPAGGDRALWSNPAIVRVGPPSPPPSPSSGLKFDFGTGTSPVAAGYTGVSTTAFTTALGYGWDSISGLESRDRSAESDPLKRDFVMSSSAPGTFKVALPSGSYSVTVTMGDHDYAHDNMVVQADGGAGFFSAWSNVDTGIADYQSKTFVVPVTAGLLKLQFSDPDVAPADTTWVVNAVTVSPTSAPPPPPAGCSDRAQFVADVTVPDGTNFAPGAAFLKTWRLRNVGTCTWTPSYLLVFDTGDQMGGPSSSNLPTTTNVPPGHTVDVSLNLTAPSAGGTHRGYWEFQNPSGNRFGIGTYANKSWWVEIWVSGPPAPPPPSPSSGLKFDFGTGTSPVAAGYTGVSTTAFTTALGYGWDSISGLESRDRSAESDPLNRDFVMSSSAPGIFKVALPNGSYSVTVTMGDHDYAHDNMVVQADGGAGFFSAWSNVDTGIADYQSKTFVVPVTAGLLKLQFSDPDVAPADTTWIVNAVTIGYKFDFGTGASAIADGYTGVSTTAFTTALGYGWDSISGLESRDRSAEPDALKRDFVMSSSGPGTFKVAVPNGSYSVTVTMGDNDYPHDNMRVKADGGAGLSTVWSGVNTTGVGDYKVKTFTVAVSAGLLQLQFSDPDVAPADTTWVVNAVTISP